jgi:hypothetical protein
MSPQAATSVLLSLQLTLSFALQVYVFQWLLTDGIKGQGWQLAARFTQPSSVLNWLKLWFSFTWRSLVWVVGAVVLVFLGFLSYLFFVAQTPESGALYVQAMFAFNPIYGDLSRASGARLYPFFLEGVAGQPGKLLPDGMHPNAQGVEDIARRLAPAVAGDLPKG